MMNYIKENEDFDPLNVLSMNYSDIDDWVDEHKQEYLDKFNLKFEDFRLDNLDNLDKKLVNKSLIDTKIELMQGVEALYHNLND